MISPSLAWTRAHRSSAGMRFASGARRVVAQVGEGGLDGAAVAPGAHALQAVELLALERRVDPQRLDVGIALGSGSG